MSRETTALAAATLPRPPLYGIGSCRVGPDYLDFEIGWDEFERDTDWAEKVLKSSGILAGDLVLITSPNWENPWTSPIVHALRRIGAVYTTAEAYAWDARRVSTLLEGLPIKAVIGLGSETLNALAAAESPIVELLLGVKIVWARRDALEQLSDVEPEVVGLVPLGPALAMGHPGQRGLLVNAREWTVDTDDGLLVVSNVGSRATTFSRVATGIRGEVRSADADELTLELLDTSAG